MNNSTARAGLVALATVWILAIAAAQAAAQPAGSAFTYQGRLVDGGSPADGAYDFRFILYDADVGGSQVGPIVPVDDVVVVAGLFTVSLDFGAGAFPGAVRFLEIAVRPGASSGAYTLLGARQEMKPAPHSLFSQATPWTGVTGKPPGFADDTDNDTTYGAGAGLDLVGTTFSVEPLGITGTMLADNAVTSAKVADGTIALADLGQNGCAANQVLKWNGTAWACAADANTTYTASTGILINGSNQVSVDSIVARKDAAAGNQGFDTNVLFLNYTSDRVGINTSAPTTPLDVNGAVRAASYSVSPAQTGTIFLSGNAWVTSSTAWDVDDDGFGNITPPQLGVVLLRAAIDPPQGATVTSLFCHFFDNDPSNNVGLGANLYSRSFSSIVASAMATISVSSSSISPSIQTASDSTITGPVIDPATAYHILVSFGASPQSSTLLRFYGCGVNYTYTTVVN